MDAKIRADIVDSVVKAEGARFDDLTKHISDRVTSVHDRIDKLDIRINGRVSRIEAESHVQAKQLASIVEWRRSEVQREADTRANPPLTQREFRIGLVALGAGGAVIAWFLSFYASVSSAAAAASTVVQ